MHGEFLNKILLSGIVISILLVIVFPVMVFATHEDEFWVDNTTYPDPPNNRVLKLVSFTDMSHIDGFVGVDPNTTSPECTNKLLHDIGKEFCHKYSKDQITTYEKWVQVAQPETLWCGGSVTKEITNHKSMSNTDETKITNSIRETLGNERLQEVNSQVKFTYGWAEASASYKESWKEYSELEKALLTQTGQSYTTVYATDEKIKHTSPDSSDSKWKWVNYQKILVMKYDLWTPFLEKITENRVKQNLEGQRIIFDHISEFPGNVVTFSDDITFEKQNPNPTVCPIIEGTKLRDNDDCRWKESQSSPFNPGSPPVPDWCYVANIVWKTCYIPTIDSKTTNGDLAFFKSSYLDNTNILHKTIIQEIPTDDISQDQSVMTRWECGGERIPTFHVNPPETEKTLKIHFKRSYDATQVIITDNDNLIVKDATVTMGLFAFPIEHGENACSSVDTTATTDKYGAAYFYLDGLEIAEEIPLTPEEMEEADYEFNIQFATNSCDISITTGTLKIKAEHPDYDLVEREIEYEDGWGWALVKDLIAPVIDVQDITKEASDENGAFVEFFVTAKDDVDGVIPSTCDKNSGVVFPVGITTVTCTASDSADNQGSESFVVTVTFGTETLLGASPTIQTPKEITVLATSESGATVEYMKQIVVTDDKDENLVPSCDPSSGSEFQIGETQVACTVKDTDENITTESFMVMVEESGGPGIPEESGGPGIPEESGGPGIPEESGSPEILKESSGPGIPDAKSFSLSTSFEGNSFMVVGDVESNMPLAITINPEESVQVDFAGGKGGEVEITLPKKMISGIHTVKSGDAEILFQQMATTETSTTLKFTVPDDTSSIEIVGANVVPEFPVVIGILAGALVMIVVFMRAKTHFILYR